jgi:hypothetical protein
MTAPTTVSITPETLVAARGRKPLPASSEPTIEINETALAVMSEAAMQASVADRMVMPFEPVLRQLGRLEMAQFYATVSHVAIANIFENLRNSGAYKNLPYNDEAGNTRYVASLDEFCEVKLGKSYRRCLDLSQNLRTLGPELYEQSERLGLRNVDYKALRNLPADDQAIVKRAIEETSSRDEVLTILQELAAKHVHEKAALESDLTQARDDLVASKGKQNVLVQNQAEQINRLAEEVSGLKHRTIAPEFLEAEALEELMADARQTAAHLRTSLVALCGNVYALFPENEASETARRGVGAALGLILAALRDTAADFDVLPEEATVVDGLNHEDAALWASVNAQIAAEATNEASNEPAQD